MARAAAIGAVIGLAVAGANLMRPAEAGCTRTIINRSDLVASVSRNGGPVVTIPPHASQPIHLDGPGRVDIALTCPGASPAAPELYRGGAPYTAIVDRCYYRFDDGFFHDYLGGGFFGFRKTAPLTLNNPRQGDLVVGPQLNGSCRSDGLRALY